MAKNKERDDPPKRGVTESRASSADGKYKRVCLSCKGKPPHEKRTCKACRGEGFIDIRLI